MRLWKRKGTISTEILVFCHPLERLYLDSEQVFLPLTLPERNLVEHLVENNARMVNNEEVTTWRLQRRRPRLQRKGKKMQSPLTTPHTAMPASKGNRGKIGESSQLNKHRMEVVDILEDTKENDAKVFPSGSPLMLSFS